MKRSIFAICLVLLALGACKKQAEPAPEARPGDSVVYELNVRQLTPEGTFAAAEAHLPLLRELGVDIIWVMPPYPIGEKGRKGSLGSYYAIRDYCDINPEFGTLEDFDHFLAEAHAQGFMVILDWVANHTAPDHPWVTEKPADWYVRDADGNTIVEYDWTDIAKLNYDNADMRAEMEKSMRFWLERGVDGFRCDVASEVPTDFWDKAFADFRGQRPGELFFLAEAETPALQMDAFDAYYAWRQMHLWYDLCAGKKDANDLADFYVNYSDEVGMPAGTWAMNFVSNHDQNSWSGTNVEMYGPAVKQFTVLTFLLPGIPMLYNGDEVCLPKRLEFFEKDPIDWSSDPYGMTALYKDLIALRDQHACLWAAPWGGSMAVLPTDHPDTVFAFEREEQGDMCLAMFNFSDQEVTYKVENHLVTTDSEFTLPAHGYHIIFSVGDCFGDCDETEFQNDEK